MVLHPEWVDGKRLWIDPLMQDVIDRVRFGDGLLGWEGDERLAVYAVPEADGRETAWQIMRLDEDEQLRHVATTKPGEPFDDRIIMWLIAHDRRRKPDNWDIGLEVEQRNEAVDADKARRADELVSEELAPRLRAALRKDFG
jgi:hypothetical protein